VSVEWNVGLPLLAVNTGGWFPRLLRFPRHLSQGQLLISLSPERYGAVLPKGSGRHHGVGFKCRKFEFCHEFGISDGQKYVHEILDLPGPELPGGGLLFEFGAAESTESWRSWQTGFCSWKTLPGFFLVRKFLYRDAFVGPVLRIGGTVDYYLELSHAPAEARPAEIQDYQHKYGLLLRLKNWGKLHESSLSQQVADTTIDLQSNRSVQALQTQIQNLDTKITRLEETPSTRLETTIDPAEMRTWMAKLQGLQTESKTLQKAFGESEKRTTRVLEALREKVEKECVPNQACVLPLMPADPRHENVDQMSAYDDLLPGDWLSNIMQAASLVLFSHAELLLIGFGGGLAYLTAVRLSRHQNTLVRSSFIIVRYSLASCYIGAWGIVLIQIMANGLQKRSLYTKSAWMHKIFQGMNALMTPVANLSFSAHLGQTALLAASLMTGFYSFKTVYFYVTTRPVAWRLYRVVFVLVIMSQTQRLLRTWVLTDAPTRQRKG
jgi:hypothetical protein